MAELVHTPIDVTPLLAAAARPECGALNLFLGTTRDHHEGRAVLRTGLVQAGFRKPSAPLILLGFKVLAAGLLPVAWLGIGLATGRPMPQTMTGLLLAAVLGFYLPTLVVAQIRAQRRESILLALPDSLDLMVVCVEAGLGITAAMQRVALEMRLASPALSDELTLVHHEMQGGIARVDALRALAMRTGVEDVYSLVAMLIQTDRLGTSIAQALRAHADSMRVRRRQRAEQMAHKATVKLAFPLVCVIVVMIGAALATRLRMQGAALGFGLSVAISFLYYGLMRATQALGHNGAMHPYVAAWSADALFGIVGVAMLVQAQRR